MKWKSISILAMILLAIVSCRKDRFDADEEIQIPDFNFAKTVTFETDLSAYNIFQGAPADLIPEEGFELLELTSSLYTDHALKQRLVKVPDGEQIQKQSDGSLQFPNGTILSKTFYYFDDDRDTSLGKNIIETRLLIKEENTWNAATYIWNEAQTDAVLELDGLDVQISWVNKSGTTKSTLYHVPTENECMTCHQSNSTMIPLGPTVQNLNRRVERNGATINQLSHLQGAGILNPFSSSQEPVMVDYNNNSASLAQRGRAYLHMNCAHCHNPNSWERSAEREFDFRYETPFDQAGIAYEEEKIRRAVEDSEMPLIGTTLIDDKGVSLIVEYLESL